MTTALDIEQIKKDLLKLDSEASPSEAHGILCGLLSGKAEIEAHEWLSALANSIEQGDLLAEEASESLTGFFLHTVQALSDNNLKFYPLLPENESAAIRLEGIAQWAQGYLMGLSMAGVRNISDYSQDVEEFIEAMASISSADDYELADDDSDEEAIVELIEFIRIGVLLLNEEMNPIRVPVDIPDDTVH